ncbi:MAG: hypothetical protein WAO95_05200 [Burkholderiales bacterium]
MRRIALLLAFLLSGCAAGALQPGPSAQEYEAEIARLKAQLAAEVAERQKLARAARAREDTLRRQLEAMKSIERGILEREDKLRSEMR